MGLSRMVDHIKPLLRPKSDQQFSHSLGTELPVILDITLSPESATGASKSRHKHRRNHVNGIIPPKVWVLRPLATKRPTSDVASVLQKNAAVYHARNPISSLKCVLLPQHDLLNLSLAVYTPAPLRLCTSLRLIRILYYLNAYSLVIYFVQFRFAADLLCGIHHFQQSEML